MEEVVDLGLPSGTLWCKYNLGVDPNKLNTPKDWYGDYYAWGEIDNWKSKTIKRGYYDQYNSFKWYNYKFTQYCYDFNSLTKYCCNSEYKYKNNVDNLKELQPEDDAAYQNIHIGNYNFYIPSKEQWDELVKYTKKSDTKIYKVNDIEIKNLYGVEYTSILNGNKIFFPYCGFYKNHELKDKNIRSYYWTTKLNTGVDCSYSALASNIYCDSHCYSYVPRCFGCCIRPVVNL